LEGFLKNKKGQEGQEGGQKASTVFLPLLALLVRFCSSRPFQVYANPRMN
jgi:hypothetical protein